MGAFLDKPKTEKTNDTGIGRVFFNEFFSHIPSVCFRTIVMWLPQCKVGELIWKMPITSRFLLAKSHLLRFNKKKTLSIKLFLFRTGHFLPSLMAMQEVKLLSIQHKICSKHCLTHLNLEV
jgi:hypothetical protein